MSDHNYDYIVIGAGSSGCVLAARLSESGKSRVALIEAGPKNRGWRVRVPVILHALMGDAERNWDFHTTPQPRLDGRQIHQPRGRGLGGTSAINAMVYIRGHRFDYDQWAKLGNPGWSWFEVLPYFRRSEAQEHGSNDFHGASGCLPVSDLRSSERATDVFLEAAFACGHKPSPDFNTGNNEGVGRYQVTQRNGERYSVARAYLKKAEQRQSLDVMTGLSCERLLFDDNRCTGVRVSGEGQSFEIHARQEVILSAGAFGSPQLLMLSGVGPGDHLRDLGVKCRLNLPGVGRNLQEHLDVAQSFHAKPGFGMAMSLHFAPRAVAGFFQYLLRRSGPLSSNVVEAGGFLHTKPGLPAPDIQLHFLTGSASADGKALMRGHSFTLGACVLRPESRGELTLSGNTIHDPPRIDLGCLNHEGDTATLIRGARMARRILNSEAFAPYRLAPRNPTHELETDEAFLDHIRANAATAYHPVGTCAMGQANDPMSVVDSKLRVHGLSGLRVVDASIMPRIVSGNTNAPCVMIGEKAADMILAAN